MAERTTPQKFADLLDSLIDAHTGLTAEEERGTAAGAEKIKEEIVGWREELREFLQEHAPQLLEHRGPRLKGPL